MWAIGPEWAEKSHHHQQAVNFQWANLTSTFLSNTEHRWTSQGPQHYLIEKDSLLSLVEGWVVAVSVVTVQLPFMINVESR